MNDAERSQVITLVSGAAVQLLDACRLLYPDVDQASALAMRSIRVAREQA